MERLFYPEDEKVHPWLAILLESYSITVQCVSAAIEFETTEDRKLARHRGCAACSRTHKSISVTPIKLVVISWYATEKIDSPRREKLIAQLKKYETSGSCPFLIDDMYSIYELRPYACRYFNVFNKVCEEGEYAYYTRNEDVLTPSQSTIDEVYFSTLPFYSLEQIEDNMQKINDGEINKIIYVLQENNWISLAAKMTTYDLASK